MYTNFLHPHRYQQCRQPAVYILSLVAFVKYDNLGTPGMTRTVSIDTSFRRSATIKYPTKFKVRISPSCSLQLK